MDNVLNVEDIPGGSENSPDQETIREVALSLAAHEKHRDGRTTGEMEKTPKPMTPGFATLPQVLRLLGTTALVAAALTYMIQGVSLSASVERHWTFVFITGILGGCGIYFGLARREVKGGRTFLALAAATVPVHFSQLGGMIHSLVGEAPPSMPAALVFSASGPAAVAVTAAVTISLLVPLTYFCFSILARSRALPLTVAYFFSSAVILLPMRESGIAAGIIVLTAAAIRGTDRYVFTGDAGLRSFEGSIVRCMFASILLTLLGRSFFYPVNALYVSTLITAAGLIFFFDVPRFFEKDGVRSALQAAGAVLASFGWILFVSHLIKPVTFLSSEIYCLFLPVSAILYALSLFCRRSHAHSYRLLAAAAAVMTLTVNQLLSGTPATSLITFVGGAVLVGAGVVHGEKGVFLSGLAAAAIGLTYHLHFAMEIFTRNLWLSLSVTGICILIMASLLEQNGLRVRHYVNRYQAALKSWN